MANGIERLGNINQREHTSEQRTDAWHAFRDRHINSSELFSLKNNQFYDVVKDMRGFKEHCLFGTMFEPIAISFIRNTYGVNIIETGSVEHPKHSFIAASPDGLYIDDNECLVNIEIKCPRMRRISQNDTIPERYLDQVRCAAMCTDAHYSEYYEFQFRLCTQWNMSSYVNFNRWYHKANRKAFPPKQCIKFGYFEFPAPITVNFKNEYILTDLTQEHKKYIWKWGYPRYDNFTHCLVFKLFDHNRIKLRRAPMKELDIVNLCKRVINPIYLT